LTACGSSRGRGRRCSSHREDAAVPHHVQRNNPEGRSMLRTAYRSWRNKKRIEEIEGVGIERDLAGLPIARIPGKFFSKDADADEKAVLAGWQKLVSQRQARQAAGHRGAERYRQQGQALYDVRAPGRRQLAPSTPPRSMTATTSRSPLGARRLHLPRPAGARQLRAIERQDGAVRLGRRRLPQGHRVGVQPALAAAALGAERLDPEMMPVHALPGDVETQDLHAELGAYITALAGAGMALFPDRRAGKPPAQRSRPAACRWPSEDGRRTARSCHPSTLAQRAPAPWRRREARLPSHRC
jgi:hypothetical protein